MLCVCYYRPSEFAKEAMSQQSLGQGEILSIRWAHDDPNPVAQEAISRADKDALAALLQARGVSLQSSSIEYPLSYQLPPATKKLRGDDGSSVAIDETIAYPDTDAQYEYLLQQQQQQQQQLQTQQQSLTDFYPSSTANSSSSNAGGFAGAIDYSGYWQSLTGTLPQTSSESEEDFIAKKRQLLSGLVVDSACGGESNVSSGNTPSSAAATVATTTTTTATTAVGQDWTEHIDPDSGATYYYNAATGESSWGEAPTTH